MVIFNNSLVVCQLLCMLVLIILDRHANSYQHEHLLIACQNVISRQLLQAYSQRPSVATFSCHNLSSVCDIFLMYFFLLLNKKLYNPLYFLLKKYLK